MWGVQVKLWDPLRTDAISERLSGVFTTRCYTNPRLPLPSFTYLPWDIGYCTTTCSWIQSNLKCRFQAQPSNFTLLLCQPHYRESSFSGCHHLVLILLNLLTKEQHYCIVLYYIVAQVCHLSYIENSLWFHICSLSADRLYFKRYSTSATIVLHCIAV